MVARWRHRLLALPLALVALIGAFFVSSSAQVSGRQIAGEGRFEAWTGILRQLDNPGEVIFGLGLGTGTNAATVATGSLATGPATDSTLVMVALSLGAIGLVLLVCALGAIVRRVSYDRRFALVPALLLCSATFNVPEISPLNVLAAIAIGVSWEVPCNRANAGTIAPTPNGTSLSIGRGRVR